MTRAAVETVALDSSVAVPLLVETHRAHADVAAWWQALPSGTAVALAGHAVAETYAVLTRLPGDARLTAGDAAELMAERFAAPLLQKPAAYAGLPADLAGRGIAGGATYDALVALAAAEHGVALATRDRRARDTYERVGVQTILVNARGGG